MISESFVFRKYTAWFAFRILCLQKVYCLVCFQDPLSSEIILPGMLSGFFVFRKYMPGMLSASYTIRMYILESMNLCLSKTLSRGCLRMWFCTSWQNFANMIRQLKWLSQQESYRNSVQEPGPNAPISFTWAWLVEEFLEWWNRGHNVNLIYPDPDIFVNVNID